MKAEIVMISGKQGSGKSTITRELLSRVLMRKNWDALELRFASIIYSIHDEIHKLMKFYGVDVPEKDGELLQWLGTDYGRKKYGENVWVNALRATIADIDKARKMFKEDNSNRLAGSKCFTAGLSFRYIQSDGAAELMNDNLLIVISDCRFINEFNAFPEALRVRLRCNENVRQSRADSWRNNSSHASETNLDDVDAAGEFDLYLDTEFTPVAGCVDLILAKLDKGGWVERRSL